MCIQTIRRLLRKLLVMDAFPDGVKSSWEMLEKFGVSLQRVDDRFAEGASRHVRIILMFEMNGRVFVKMAPLCYAGTGYQGMINLERILFVLAPELQFIVHDTENSSAKIQAEVDRQITLLVQYCRPLLEGDISSWPEIVEFNSLFQVPLHLYDEVLKEWSSVMKKLMSSAVEKQNYVLVHNVCAAMALRGIELTQEEAAAYQLAEHEVKKLRQHHA